MPNPLPLPLAIILARVPRERHEELIELFNERAGIIEYEAKQPRAVAEAEALREIEERIKNGSVTRLDSE